MNSCYSLLLESSCQDYPGLQFLGEDLEYSLFDSILDTEASSMLPMFDSDYCTLLEFQEPEVKDYGLHMETKPNLPQRLPGEVLTYTGRQLKIKKYLEKKRKRTWHKKISYTCRKKVADQRIRVKGRFVSKKLAETLATQPPVSII